ncbi:MAG TPA: ABC transporter permease [Caulobacteraceae bacterium]|nr:ABC transporter permease [Caulobacteraceae bacterium]
MRRSAAILAPSLFIGVLLAIWEGACRGLAVPAYFLPAPSAIALALARNWPLLFVSAGRTLVTALTAFAVVNVLANASALAAASNRIVEASFRPLAVALQVTPVVALAPLFQVWAGIDHPERAVVALASVVAFFPVYSGALAGLGSADPELERLFDLYGANAWQRLTRLRIPSAVPHALEGQKVALGLSLVGAVIAELVAGAGGEQGLAWRITEASHRLEMAKSLAALVALILMGSVLHLAFEALERWALARWRGR